MVFFLILHAVKDLEFKINCKMFKRYIDKFLRKSTYFKRVANVQKAGKLDIGGTKFRVNYLPSQWEFWAAYVWSRTRL